MIVSHLPILPVLVPLVGATVCVLARRRRAAYAVSLAASWAAFGLALRLLARVLEVGPLRYEPGGWAAPWGIEYRVDPLAAFVVVFVTLVGAVVMSYAPHGLAREIPPDRHYLFWATYLLCLTGLLGIAVTADLFNLFVFLEISSLSAYVMISLGPSRRALKAAFQYLIIGTVGATFILIGVGLLYMMTGTLNMTDMAQRVVGVSGTRTVRVAIAFFTVGLGLKMALFPLHQWLPDAYTYAPSAVSAFLAGTSTKVSVYVLVRFLFTMFGTDLAFETLPVDQVLLPVSLLTILVTSMVAIFQDDVKRMLAYSSLAQIGYMVLGLSLASSTGLTASIVHMFNHAMMKTALFLATGCMVLRLGSSRLEAMRGIGRTMPWTMMAWTLGGLALVGVPATVGFVSKWYLIRASLEARWWPVAAVVLVSSLLALIYVWRVVEIAFFREPASADGPRAEAPIGMLLPTWALIGATLVFGVSARATAGVAERAARALLGAGP